MKRRKLNYSESTSNNDGRNGFLNSRYRIFVLETREHFRAIRFSEISEKMKKIKEDENTALLQGEFSARPSRSQYFVFKRKSIGYLFEYQYDTHFYPPNNFIAYDVVTGERVGILTLFPEDDYTWLSFVEVKDAYQRKGIATTLLRMALVSNPDLKVPTAYTQKSGTSAYFSEAGQAWADKCFERNILSHELNNPANAPKKQVVYTSSFD